MGSIKGQSEEIQDHLYTEGAQIKGSNSVANKGAIEEIKSLEVNQGSKWWNSRSRTFYVKDVRIQGSNYVANRGVIEETKSLEINQGSN